MPEYFFQLSQRDTVSTHGGGSTRDDDAQLEAVHFLGEVLRDMSAADAGTVTVTVVKGEQAIFTVRAVMSEVTA